MFGLLLWGATNVIAQADSEAKLNVFLDCDECDSSHIRTELDFINYVRDPAQADLHVFITENYTVLNGRQYEFSSMNSPSLGGVIMGNRN